MRIPNGTKCKVHVPHESSAYVTTSRKPARRVNVAFAEVSLSNGVSVQDARCSDGAPANFERIYSPTNSMRPIGLHITGVENKGMIRIHKPIIHKRLQKLCPECEVVSSVKGKVALREKIERKGNVKVYDELRYTVVVPGDYRRYVKRCHTITKSMIGSKYVKVRNHWKNPERAYRGYHLHVDTGVCCYEIQVHTPRSLIFREDEMSRWTYERTKHHPGLGLLLAALLVVYSPRVQIEALQVSALFNG